MSWEGSGPVVALLHGFTLRGVSFARVAAGRNAVAPDLPGHGATDVNPIRMGATVAALATWLESTRPALVVGYSMGGRVALHLGLDRPELVPRMLLVSTGLGIADAHERAARTRSDERLAATIEKSGVARFIERWIDHPIAGTARVDPQLRMADSANRLGHDPLLLAEALRALGPAGHGPLHDRLADLEMPTAWMAGSLDPAYAEIARVGAAASDGEATVVAGAGHNLILEAPESVGAVIDRLVREG